LTARQRIIFGVMFGLGCLSPSGAIAYDPMAPTFQTSAGKFVGGGHDEYLVESELRVPVLQLGPAIFSYYYRETTPFLDVNNAPRAQVLYRRNELQADLKLNDCVRLIAVGGYERTDFVDRHGLLSAYAAGGGVGSVRTSDNDRLVWFLLGGGYLSRKGTDVDWWTDAHLSWRVWQLDKEHYLQSESLPAIGLSVNAESANEDDQFHGFYRIGPELQLITANNNRASLQLQWYSNESDPFYGRQENGVLLNFRVDSTLQTNYVFHAREERKGGWLPLVWGGYDIGADATRRVSRFQMNVEVVDFAIKEQPVTVAVWYESRQEYRFDGFDNIAYSVTAGLQTPIGLESIASHGDPLVFGAGFMHRSDHSLNPDAIRVPPGGLLTNGSHNLIPRLLLQTQGWDLPYRNPDMYQRKTEFLNLFDWRVTAGYDVRDTNDRGKLAGQLGLNWDAATIDGCVVYLQGLGSVGNETPDWLGELGVRRPAAKVFTRFERYGMEPQVARGNTFWVGFGVFL
jgi:hypothetical protein